MIYKKFIFVSLTNEITFLHLPRESPYLWWLNWNSYFQGLALQSRKLNKIYILGKYPLVMYLFSFALQRNSECYGENVFLYESCHKSKLIVWNVSTKKISESRSLGTKWKPKNVEFWPFIDPSVQNQLYHTPLLFKIWDLTKNRKIVNDPFKTSNCAVCSALAL